MIEVAGLALPFFGLIFLGFLAGKIWRKQDDATFAWLNIFVIYFSLPALFFQLISRTPIDQLANWSFVFATSLATYTAFALAFGFAVARNGGNVPEATIQGMVGGYGNVGYMGPPLALVALGPAAAVPAALIFCFDVALAFTLAPLMMAIAGTGESFGRTLLSIPGKVLLHPFIVATLVGVAGAAIGVRPPAPVDRLLDSLAGSSAPCALFALGVTVASRPLKRVPAELPFLILVKLAIHPAMAFLILSWIGGFQRIWVETAVLMACLPPAATIYVIASQYRTYVLRASSAILLGTAASVPTVTGVLYLITHDLLPFGVFAP